MQLLQGETKEGANVSEGNGIRRLTIAEFAARSAGRADEYHRYQIDTNVTKDVQPLPNRFIVKVGKVGLAKFLLKETFQYWGKWDVIMTRPCTYGVFSGPVGGFNPRPKLCVGCLRCTIQHPEFTTIAPNPARAALGDDYVTHLHISAIDEEASKGTIPVRGQGYRGKFGGPGWEGMFTDMSEIVRPSRDGIHGRELIGTSVDIGSKPMSLEFDESGALTTAPPRMLTIQVPFIFDAPPASIASPKLHRIYTKTAADIDTLVALPADVVLSEGLASPAVGPIIPLTAAATSGGFGHGTRMVELDGWDASLYLEATTIAPHLLIGVRIPFAPGWQQQLLEVQAAGVPVIHLIADHHGLGEDGGFVMDTLREAHMLLIDAGVRDAVTLLGSGGIIAADHLPKAIICGLDAVALDLPLLFAMQARARGDLSDRERTAIRMPRRFSEKWAVSRLTNLAASWRDQLLEILGAMGIREVRRLRGEMGRGMWQADLEAEAFAGIEGFPGGGA